MTISLRKAEKKDIPTVFRMSVELGDYLKDVGPKWTLDDLLNHGGFEGENERPFFAAFIAEDSDVLGSDNQPAIVGYTLLSYMYTWAGKTIYMEDLYVTESHRSKGVGKLLFNFVVKHAKETGSRRIQFEVVKWNPARKFYEKMKAINATEDCGYLTYMVTKDVIEAAE